MVKVIIMGKTLKQLKRMAKERGMTLSVQPHYETKYHIQSKWGTTMSRAAKKSSVEWYLKQVSKISKPVKGL